MRFANWILPVFLLFQEFPGTAQSNSSADTLRMIAREWKFTEVKGDDIDSRDLEEIKKARIHFRPDNSYDYNDGTETSTGKWKFDPVKKEIVLFDVGDHDRTIQVLSISSEKMKIRIRDDVLELDFTSVLVPVK